MAKTARKKRIESKVKSSPFQFYWTKENYILLGMGLVLLIVGYWLMSQGPWDSVASLTISPIVLLIAYLIIFPLAVFYKKRKVTSDSLDSEDAAGQS